MECSARGRTVIRRWMLPLVIGLELTGAVFAIGWRLSRPVPPAVNNSRLDSVTAADLQALRAQAGTSAEKWFELGEAYMAYGFFPEAEACLGHAAELRPDSFHIEYAWAYSLQRLGRLEEAIDRFQTAAAIAPADMLDACWYHVGRCHLRREDVAAAERAFAKRGEFPPAAFQLAKILIRSGRADEALPILEELIQNSPHDLQPLQLRARTERALGRHEVADDFRKRTERATGDLPLTDHHAFLNPIRFRYGPSRLVAVNAELRSRGLRRQSAAGYREMMSDLDFWDRRKMAPMLAELELELDRPQAAEELLLELFEHSNTTPHTLMLLGDAQMLQMRPGEARQTYERALRMRPGFQLHVRLTRYFEQTGDAGRARHHAARAYAHQGIDAFRQNKLEEAIAALDMAVELDPEHDQSWFYLGATLRASGETDAAVTAFERCLALNPAHGRAHAAVRLFDDASRQPDESGD